MSKLSFVERWRLNRKFPILWMTYKKRIGRDLDKAISDPEAKDAFSSEYIEKLDSLIQRVESWIFKLYSIQIAIAAFFVLGFISNKLSISLFGISLSDVVGLKEILLAIWVSIGVVIAVLGTSRDTSVFVAEKVFEHQQNTKFSSFTKLVAPAAFSLHVYLTREREDWIFPTLPSRLLFGVLSVVAVIAFLSVLVFSLLLSVFIFREIYRNPTLGVVSYMLLGYSALIYAFSLLWLIRFTAPLPYRDQSDFKRIVDLQETDPAAFQARGKEYLTKLFTKNGLKG